MDVDSDDHLEVERNGTTSNSDSYLTHVEYRVPRVFDLNELINVLSIYLDISLTSRSGTSRRFLPATPLPRP